jgi:glycosyltransferase involved in cell wall biosynthesis
LNSELRICIVYDHFFPHTIGGAERWLRGLAERLAKDGHQVTFVTLQHWEDGELDQPLGVRVVTLGRSMAQYGKERRRIVPAMLFGLRLMLHLLRHGRKYDVVHTASFPYFSILGAAAAGTLAPYQLVVDWVEVWTFEYWREYLGPIGGWIGWRLQQACMRVTQRAVCFSRLNAGRLKAFGFTGDLTIVKGAHSERLFNPLPRGEPLIVFAGRHIREKRVPDLVVAFARVRQFAPELRLLILGDGPEREKVIRLVEELRLRDVVHAPGFVSNEEMSDAVRRAACLVLPSRREGYGLVVVEACARGTPVVVVTHPDNAATELVQDGINGVIASSSSAVDLSDAILRVYEAGEAMRATTVDWFSRNSENLSLEHAFRVVLDAYIRDEELNTGV